MNFVIIKTFSIVFLTDINECEATVELCLNEGTCENTVGTYVCHCTNTWTGLNCETGNIYIN